MIRAGHIAAGEVDERSIEEVRARDLEGFDQCHFFAGIGTWSAALRAAGWADDTPVWSGSCPCQSFSASGKRGGFSDPRHLWPAWFRLIRECRPDTVFGEQVAAKGGLAWLDVVSADLEGEGYAVGTADTCAAGFGAPHIRQRLYFVADCAISRKRSIPARSREEGGGATDIDGRCGIGSMDYAAAQRLSLRARGESRGEAHTGVKRLGEAGILDDADKPGLQGRHEITGAGGGECAAGPQGVISGMGDAEHFGHNPQEQGSSRPCSDGARGRIFDGAGPVNGFWRDAEWVPCRNPNVPGAVDWRPVEPGTFPLAYGLPRGMGTLPSGIRKLAEMAGLSQNSLREAKAFRRRTLQGYGNAIVPQQAEAFIRAYLETRCW